MNFTDALIEMKNGVFVKRADWQDGYCCIMPDMNTIWRILTAPQVQTGNYLPLIADLEADDWMKYDGKKAIVEAAIDVSPEVPPVAA